MQNRRNFLKQASLMLAGGLVAPQLLSSCGGKSGQAAATASESSKYIGLQLYSLRDLVKEEGIQKVLETAAKMGYKNLETASYDNGKIYGLGSNDAGASVVSLFQVYRHLSITEQAYNLIFLASCEEEVSGKNGIESVLPQLPPITLGIVGEPTEMQPAIAEKGLMVLDVTAYGKAGHAARNEGVNAIYKVLEDIQWFRDYKFPKESSLLGPVKMSVTQINAGTQHNVIPDTCTFVVDIRSNECYSNEELFKEISARLKSEAKARSFRLNSSHISAEHPFVKRAVKLGRVPFGSPTLSDQALMKFPSVKIGPGKSSRSHTADEYIMVSEIEEAIRLYIEMLDGLVL